MNHELEPAEAEYQSWLELLRAARFWRCPDGGQHDDEHIPDHPTFWSRCKRCGHHTDLPF